MLFSEVLESLAPDRGREQGAAHEFAVTVTADWMQGRSVFGGMQSALALRAMRSLVPADVPLRTLQTTFIGPVEGAMRVRAQVLRTGKNVVHAEARIVAGDSTCAIVIGVFGRGRPSRAEVAPEAPAFTPEGEPFVFSYIEGVSAAFIQHFDVTWLAGPLLFTGAREAPHAALSLRMKDRGPATEAHVVAIADMPPPLALSMLTERTMGSSLTWNLELLTDRFDDLPLEGWRLRVELRAGHDGYTSQAVTVCAPDGRPVAFGNQTMVVFG